MVTSLILNIPVFQKKLSQITLSDILEDNGLIKELNKQADLPKFSKSSTARFRYLVKGICIENGQATRNFSDNKQNDAGEFLMSVLRHIFEGSRIFHSFDEHIFGGLWQTTLVRTRKTELEVTKIPEVVPLELYGVSLQDWPNHFFLPEVIERKCPNCVAVTSKKNYENCPRPCYNYISVKQI